MRRQETIFSLLFLLVFLSFYGCGKPEVIPPQIEAIAIESPILTMISGQVEGIAPGTQETVVTLFDVNGAPIAEAFLKEDGTFSVPTLLTQSQSGFYRISVKGERGIDLEGAIDLQVGKEITKDQLKIDPVTTLALFLGEAYNASKERALERAITFYTPILKSFDPAIVKTALLELRNPSENFDTFIGGANAFKKVLEALFSFVEPQPVVF